MTADSFDDRLALAGALAHLAAVAGSATPETQQALAVVLPLVTTLQDAALPAVDLAALKHDRYDEWGWNARHPDTEWWARQYAITAGLEPDVDGYTVNLGSRGLTRDEIPHAAAFLMAIHAMTDPAELEKRYACDCFPDDPADPVHEPWCAANDRPVTS